MPASRMVGRGITLLDLYERLLRRFGPQGWWPADDDVEMAVGAILTQSTSWVNVEKAIAGLKARGAVSWAAIDDMPVAELAELVRPSGYFAQKARKLKAFAAFLRKHHAGRMESLFHVKLPELRQQLLGVWGIGPETADSIILYGARKPVFVVDAYTRRIFGRVGLTSPDACYDDLQSLFMEHLPSSVQLFQEYHALLVALGKEVCRPKPRCEGCPLRDRCAAAAQSDPPASEG